MRTKAPAGATRSRRSAVFPAYRLHALRITRAMPESFDSGPTLARRFDDDAKACPAKVGTGFAKKDMRKQTAQKDREPWRARGQEGADIVASRATKIRHAT